MSDPYNGGFKPPAPAGPSYNANAGGPGGQNLFAAGDPRIDYGQNAGLTAGTYRARAIGGAPNAPQDTPQYGGQYGLAQSIAGQYGNQAEDAWHRQIANDVSGQYRMNQGQARGLQQGALGMQMQAAQGEVPSAALIGQGVGLSRAGEQASMAAKMGGGANPLGALRMHAGAAQGAVGNAAQARAEEIGNANTGWLNQAGAIRGGDQSAYGLDTQREIEQARLNQALTLGSQGLANQTLLDQLGASTQQYGAQLGYQTQSELAAAQRARDMQNAVIGGIAQGGAGLLNAYGTSGPNGSNPFTSG